MVEQYVLDLRAVAAVPVAGGKGAGLGELTRIEGVRVPPGFVVTTAAGPEMTDEIAAQIGRLVDEGAAYAVRSSATAEDLPTASFAGQHDTYLNVRGAASVIEHVARCWESLHTERAVAYRSRNGFDDRSVRMAVVVQRMVAAEASGVLFTADPVSGNRTVTTVDAVRGLGEDLVSGLVNPEAYRVRDGEIVAAKRSVLTGAQILELAALGRRIEAHFGRPQDIEWCLDADGFAIVQSRPITTLFPVPASSDGKNHVYLSVGHQQMMTDAMKPLGISMWQLTAMAPMLAVGGRLWVDATRQLASAAGRAGFLKMVGRGDPLFRDALETVIERGFVDLVDDAAGAPRMPGGAGPGEADPAIVPELIKRNEASLDALKQDIRGRTGPELFAFLTEAFQEHKRLLADPESMQAIMAGMGATWWLNDHLEEWLGERNVADTLTLSAPGNITSEMGLALLDVADAFREFPEALADVEGDLPAGPREAFRAYLDRYGMRCAGEIDITRPRWSERPSTLAPLILDNIKLFEPGAAGRRFQEGLRRAETKRREILERLSPERAEETVRMIDRLRAFIGYREYPKYAIISRYFVYKQALLAEADRLVRAGAIAEREDIFYLTFQELRDGWEAGLVERRKDEFRADQALIPPRLLTSEGEGISGEYRRDDVPAGALAGLPVSAGTVEGRARVILDMAEADLEAGDILVTAFTDPSWSPLFVAVAGLVTEVGGLMTHGAVIAREYGLPAVVGVAGATRLIADGRRIRVHGAEGYVELLPAL